MGFETRDFRNRPNAERECKKDQVGGKHPWGTSFLWETQVFKDEMLLPTLTELLF